MKIAVCVPWSSPFIWTRFVESMAAVRSPEGVEVRWFFGRGWAPARRHITALEKGLEWGADFLCIFGADQVAPPNMLEKLYKGVCEGRPAMCALVPSRGYFDHNHNTKPFQPLAWRWASVKLNDRGQPIVRPYRGQDLDPDMMETIIPDGTVQPVHMIGSGCIMFHREHLLALKQPWFSETFNPINYSRVATMDTVFSWRLVSEAGAPLFCDTSIKIGHLSDLMIDDTFQDRFLDWKDPSKPTSEPEIIRRKKVLA